jgi:hypothetical protein
MSSFMKIHVCWMNLIKNQIIKKFQSLNFLKEQIARQMIHLKNYLAKKYCQMGSKFVALSASHM